MKRFFSAALAVFASSCFAATPDLPSCDSWQPAASCNFQNASRPSSSAINYVIIHKVEGSAAGAASWFQNCAAGVSAHYAFNNTSGYCYQCVYEADIAWHCINRNTNGVGIEHGGYTNTNDVATACYDESALETKSCIIYYTVAYDRSHIQGHSEVPGNSHTDPGPYWNWTYYMSKCNPNGGTITPKSYIDDTPAVSANWITGTSAADKYGADYKYRSTAAVSDAATWTSTLANGGSYDISAWWSQGSNRSATAPYILPNGATVNKNQQANGGAWNLLGTQTLAAGAQTTKLSCWTTTGFVVVADAIKFYGPK